MTDVANSRGPLREAELLTGCAGRVVFVGLLVLSPRSSGGCQRVVVRLVDQDNLDAIAWTVAAGSVAFGAMLVFLAGLYQLMRAAAASSRSLSYLAAFSGVLVAAWFWMQASIDFIPWVLADDDGKLTQYSDEAVLSLDPIGRLGETFGDLSQRCHGA